MMSRVKSVLKDGILPFAIMCITMLMSIMLFRFFRAMDKTLIQDVTEVAGEEANPTIGRLTYCIFSFVLAIALVITAHKLYKRNSKSLILPWTLGVTGGTMLWNSNIVPCKMDLDIIYEDECYIVLNKPPHIAIHPSILHYDNSLSNGVRYYFDSINLHKKIRPVNRLDKDTSGLVVFAKNEYIQECLVSQMKTKEMKKTYIAICAGTFNEKSGTINKPIARKPGSIIERCIDSSGDTAITHYKVLNECNNISVVECILETGRTHQIRVHLSSIDHPILGDTLYGNESPLANRQLLHAYKLEFIHPITRKKVCYTAPIPGDFNLGTDSKF